MNRILILFAHPRLEKSRANRAMLAAIQSMEGVTVHDLYEHYPAFDIHIEKEKQLLTNHDIIIWQHPFYWYSAPALMKQWIDLVLEFGWAYGPGGNALKGKYIFSAITTGGNRAAYCEQGRNRCSVEQFLMPFRQTATLCQMFTLPPWVVHGTHKLTESELEESGMQFRRFLMLIRERIPIDELIKYEYINDYLEQQLTQ